MKTIPLRAIPSQEMSVILGTQNCQIAVYQKTTGLYLDLSINNAPVTLGVICRDRVRLVRQAYLGFTGEIAFADLQGKSDPDYTGLGSRFVLVYLEPADLL